jgi:hypothetical protein
LEEGKVFGWVGEMDGAMRGRKEWHVDQAAVVLGFTASPFMRSSESCMGSSWTPGIQCVLKWIWKL